MQKFLKVGKCIKPAKTIKEENIRIICCFCVKTKNGGDSGISIEDYHREIHQCIGTYNNFHDLIKDDFYEGFYNLQTNIDLKKIIIIKMEIFKI